MNKSGFPNNTSSRQIRLLGFLILFAFLCSLISILLQNSEIVRDWENRFQSRYYLLRFSFSQPEAIDLPLILVLIDDHSLPVGTPRSPIDRNWLADLISNLSNHKPALIGINILLDRTGNQTADNRLINSIQTAGNVILRSDPFYPTHPSFEKAALDKGTIRFKLDSSDTVQEVCANQLTCQSSNLFHLKILDYYQKIKNGTVSVQTPKMPWMKINFAVANQDTTGKNVLSFPVIKAQEVSQIPDSAFKDKIVLVGTGFPDLFPLYRVPLSSPGITLQETEVVAQVLSMIAGNRFFYSLSPIVAGTILFIILTFISFVTIRKGSLLAILISFMFILAFLISSGWAFAFRDLEIPFVL
ncbi:CHASE2 domain-containing protein, partial [bacterium]|nr:CHASE2 domain-containing protein [bacterium]